MIEEILIKLGLTGKPRLKVVHYDGVTVYIRWQEGGHSYSAKAALIDGQWKTILTNRLKT